MAASALSIQATVNMATSQHGCGCHAVGAACAIGHSGQRARAARSARARRAVSQALLRALRVALGVGLGAEGDQVGQLRHRFQVAQLGQARQPQRVQLVARQQRRSTSSGCTHLAGAAVVQR